MSEQSRSAELFQRAQEIIPGGVNSPVRAFGSVGGTPRFMTSGRGAVVTDADGNEYVDYVGSWGPLVLGHRDDDVLSAMTETMQAGWTFGAPTALETDVARMVCDMVPSVEMVRMVNSGTEATLSALRLARGFTGRDVVVKFSGCYHGHHDALLVAAGSGLATLGTPSSPGVTEGTTRDTLVLPFNDADALRAAAAEHGDRIACVIIEPVAGNMGVVAPLPGFLETLREVCTDIGALLIFDEVMTGFRLARGGAQELYGVTPDLTTMGKIIGGGLPVGAYGGRADVMQTISPAGGVYQAGTLSGNPLAMTAGSVTLGKLADGAVYPRLEKLGAAIEDGLAGTLERNKAELTFARVGSMFTVFFVGERVTSFDVAQKCDTERYAKYFHEMLNRGFYLPPSQFEANFISAAHSDDQIKATVAAMVESLRAVGLS